MNTGDKIALKFCTGVQSPYVIECIYQGEYGAYAKFQGN